MIQSTGMTGGTFRKIAAAFPHEQVELYLNTLWLQDPDRWAALAD